MYRVGDLLFYGNVGVCQVIDITSCGPEGIEKEFLYYVLNPKNQSCTIFVPTHTSTYMRSILTKDEANDLIDTIPTVEIEKAPSHSLNRMEVNYKESIETHDCAVLLKLCMTIYAKKEEMQQNKRKLGAVDEKYMRRAEDLLYGELSAALEIEKDAIPQYIQDRIQGQVRL